MLLGYTGKDPGLCKFCRDTSITQHKNKWPRSRGACFILFVLTVHSGPGTRSDDTSTTSHEQGCARNPCKSTKTTCVKSPVSFKYPLSQAHANTNKNTRAALYYSLVNVLVFEQHIDSWSYSLQFCAHSWERVILSDIKKKIEYGFAIRLVCTTLFYFFIIVLTFCIKIHTYNGKQWTIYLKNQLNHI